MVLVSGDEPNPRGWRDGLLFVDLGSVAVALYDYARQNVPYTGIQSETRQQSRVMRLYLVNAGDASVPDGALELSMTEEQALSFLGALEIYRSNR